MPALTLTRLWVNLMSTGEGISGASNRKKQWTVDVDVNVRTYANGRRRAISSPGIRREIPYTMLAVALPTRDYLESWLGRNVQVRDTRGQKWFGVFGGLSVLEHMPPTLYDVSFTLQTTTTSEGV